MNHEISSTFVSNDRSACDALERKRDDLARARKLSRALVPSLESEIAACEVALERAREAASEFDRESVEHVRAEAQRRQAVTELNASTEIDPDAAREIVISAETAKYLEGARGRRVNAARDAATSAYGRASKGNADRTAAVTFAERLAGAVVDRELDRVKPETRPGVIAWLPLVFPNEGAAAYARSYETRISHPSYPVPPGLEEYAVACKSYFAGVERTRAQAAKLAAELASVSEAQADAE